jgi:hypothetical protein
VLSQEPDDVHAGQYDAGWIAHHRWAAFKPETEPPHVVQEGLGPVVTNWPG